MPSRRFADPQDYALASWSGRNPRSIVLATTVASTALAFVKGQAEYLSSLGWHVTIVSAPSEGFEELAETRGVDVRAIPMRRSPSPLADLSALAKWCRLLMELRPEVVMAGTPKAGLLATVAGFLTRTPVRIYLVRGLRAEGLGGWQKQVSLASERLASRLATSVVSVSPSLRSRLIDFGLVDANKIVVLGDGSSNGVDTDRFRPPTLDQRAASRAKWGFASDEVVVGYVGRLASQKGIDDLNTAFGAVHGRNPNARLLIVGAVDAHDPPTTGVPELRATAGVVAEGPVPDPTEAFWAMDIFVMPSHREGMPNASLEASASGLPVVTTWATGCQDSIAAGSTGLFVEPRNPSDLASALLTLSRDPAQCTALGSNGRRHVIDRFRQDLVWRNLVEYLESERESRARETQSQRVLHDT